MVSFYKLILMHSYIDFYLHKLLSDQENGDFFIVFVIYFLSTYLQNRSLSDNTNSLDREGDQKKKKGNTYIIIKLLIKRKINGLVLISES